MQEVRRQGNRTKTRKFQTCAGEFGRVRWKLRRLEVVASGEKEVEDDVCFRRGWFQNTLPKKDKDPREEKASTSHRFCVTVLHDVPTCFLLFYTGRPLLKYFHDYYYYAFFCIKSRFVYNPLLMLIFLKKETTCGSTLDIHLELSFQGTRVRVCVCMRVLDLPDS